MTSARTIREMRRGAAVSAYAAAHPAPRRYPEKGDHVIVGVFRPVDGAGSQDRKPETIGKGVDLFSPIRRRM